MVLQELLILLQLPKFLQNPDVLSFSLKQLIPEPLKLYVGLYLFSLEVLTTATTHVLGVRVPLVWRLGNLRLQGRNLRFPSAEFRGELFHSLLQLRYGFVLAIKLEP